MKSEDGSAGAEELTRQTLQDYWSFDRVSIALPFKLSPELVA
jgi:hypothetical protein